MDNKNEQFDPLKALMDQQVAAVEGKEISGSPKTALDELKTANAVNTTSDVDYGDNDLDQEIAAEEAADKQARIDAANAERAKLEAQEAARPFQAPDEYDMSYHDEAMDFQSEKLNIVTGMVNRVVAKYRIISGGIPEKPFVDKKTNQVLTYGKRPVMGELIELYQKNGEKINDDFEKTILVNWIMPDGTRAIDNLNENNIVIDKTMFNAPTNNTENKETVAVVANDTPNENENAGTVTKKEPVPTINISVDKEVQKNNPVNINIDKDIAATVRTVQEVNVVVREVSNEELKKTTIYRNSEKTGIINVTDTGINDVSVTLPMSGYRCTMRSVNWYDFISLTAPSANNGVDSEIKKWSVIYKHIKNPSIGNFENFEDFLKKTKYQDRELLMWGILVATSDEEETLDIKCNNPDCENHIKVKYSPRTITKTDKDLEPAWYEKAKIAAPGEEAKSVWEEANSRKTSYTLPHSGIEVELSESSAYDFVNKKLRLINDLYKRYRPNDTNSEGLANVGEDLSMIEFDYLVANALYIESFTVTPKDANGNPYLDDNGNIIKYCYDKWETIEQIITEVLDGEDSAILMKLIQDAQSKSSPISFRVENIICPECGKERPYIQIDDIGQTLLFQLSRRFGDIKINLNKTDSN